LTGNPTLATLYRDRSAKIIKRDLGIDINEPLPAKATKITPKQWGEWATANEEARQKGKPAGAFPDHIVRYAVLKNRELNQKLVQKRKPPVDEFDRWGFAVAFFRVVEGLDERIIKRQIQWDANAKLIIYKDIRATL